MTAKNPASWAIATWVAVTHDEERGSNERQRDAYLLLADKIEQGGNLTDHERQLAASAVRAFAEQISS